MSIEKQTHFEPIFLKMRAITLTLTVTDTLLEMQTYQGTTHNHNLSDIISVCEFVKFISSRRHYAILF